MEGSLWEVTLHSQAFLGIVTSRATLRLGGSEAGLRLSISPSVLAPPSLLVNLALPPLLGNT